MHATTQVLSAVVEAMAAGGEDGAQYDDFKEAGEAIVLSVGQESVNILITTLLNLMSASRQPKVRRQVVSCLLFEFLSVVPFTMPNAGVASRR